MTAATIARANAVSCEVKKHAYRQTQDGFVISFILHPQEVPEELATAGLGTRYVMALSEIGDDEQPVERIAAAEQPARQEQSASVGRSPAQVAGYLCTLGSFQEFLREKFTDQWVPNAVAGRSKEDVAKETLYDICAVTSRTQLTKDNTEWHALQLAYRLWEKEAEVVPA